MRRGGRRGGGVDGVVQDVRQIVLCDHQDVCSRVRVVGWRQAVRQQQQQSGDVPNLMLLELLLLPNRVDKRVNEL